MNIQYTGPSILQQSVEEIYSMIAGDYERRNPIIHVSIPGLLIRTTFKNESLPFDSQQQFNLYVNSIMTGILAGRETCPDYELRVQLHELGNTRFSGSQTDSTYVSKDAIYDVNHDVVFVSAFCAAYYYAGIKVDPKRDTDLSLFLRHELTHWDVASAKPFKELRKVSAVVEDIAIKISEFDAGPDKSPEANEKFRQYLETRTGYEGDEAGLSNEINRITGEAKSIKKRFDRINIEIANEALAYLHGGTIDGFNRYLKSIKFRGKSAMKLYQNLSKLIGANGKIQTKRKVVNAMNRAWDKDTDFFKEFKA